ncbi:mucin-5AC [Ceratitis capitata]|uniref:mucin-5AC n=1 Tax=Ceratitis capitata TaxID=7213 RepID=UPI0003296A98|nr:mucin-5AC [Ceratitis capitata]
MGNVFFVIILYVLRIDGTLQRDTCEGLEEGTRLPHSTQCDRFIICRTQRMYSVGRCPRGLHFNRRLGVCDFKLHARCDTYLSMPNPKALSKESIYEDNCCSGCNCNCNSIKAPFYETAAADDILLPDSKGPSTGPSGTTCNNKGICENQPDGAMFLRPGSNGYIVCQCECEIPMSCPPNLIFNSVLKVCDWQNIHPHTESTLPIRATTVSKYLPAYDTSSTLYRSSTSSYLSTSGTSSMPWDSTPTRQIAVTTDISSTPNYPTTSGTASTSSDTKTKSATSTTSNPAAGPSGTTCNNKGVCENQSDGAMFPNPETNGYIVCQCECEIPMPCPSGLIFNPVLKVCDWPVSPPATVSPPPIRTTTVSSSTPKHPSSSDTSSTQYRSSISSYLSSTSTSSMPWDSTSTTQIAVTTDISSTPNYPTTSGTVSSSSDTTTKSATSTTSNPAAGPSGTTCNNKGVCENQPDGAMFPNPETNGYIVCQCECEIPMPCPSGLIFNPLLKVCDWPRSDVISASSPSTGPSGTVCNNKGKCNGQKDGTLFADPNTSGFIVCQCECEVIMPCPTGLTFNPSVNVCDWPQTFL